jgi:hypothetical protein
VILVVQVPIAMCSITISLVLVDASLFQEQRKTIDGLEPILVLPIALPASILIPLILQIIIVILVMAIVQHVMVDPTPNV